ncbi:DUF6478 family protein [Albidovulum aquaemixtae]|nr:DUF6478 family protein [Defluviimonas aquaemixtae]
MRNNIDTLLDRLLLRRTRVRWQDMAERAARLDADGLRELRGSARELRRELDQVLRVAEEQLALPSTDLNAVRKPLMADWAWRPELWRDPVAPAGIAGVENGAGFGSEATIFHDCPLNELAVRQYRNPRDAELAPYSYRMDVFGFDGSFLSLVLNLPGEAVEGLTLGHVIRLDAAVEMERPKKIFARLNVRHGPNTEQIVRELPLMSDEVMVEFDLAYSKMNEKRVERAWLDLIFDEPAMNQITLRDLTMSRRPRAEI